VTGGLRWPEVSACGSPRPLRATPSASGSGSTRVSEALQSRLHGIGQSPILRHRRTGRDRRDHQPKDCVGSRMGSQCLASYGSAER
jgi:hypothetical protein